MRVLPFPSQRWDTSPDPHLLVRDLRMAIWLTPFITDGDARAMILQLTDAIAASLGAPAPAQQSNGGVR